MQGEWHGSIDGNCTFIGHTGAWQIIAPQCKRNLCSKSMLRRFAVRHEPLYAVVFLQEVICEPPKIIIKRPSFDSQLRGQGVDTHGAADAIWICTQRHTKACTASASWGVNVADCRG